MIALYFIWLHWGPSGVWLCFMTTGCGKVKVKKVKSINYFQSDSILKCVLKAILPYSQLSCKYLWNLASLNSLCSFVNETDWINLHSKLKQVHTTRDKRLTKSNKNATFMFWFSFCPQFWSQHNQILLRLSCCLGALSCLNWDCLPVPTPCFENYML